MLQIGDDLLRSLSTIQITVSYSNTFEKAQSRSKEFDIVCVWGTWGIGLGGKGANLRRIYRQEIRNTPTFVVKEKTTRAFPCG